MVYSGSFTLLRKYILCTTYMYYKVPISRRVWCKPKSKAYWEAAKQGVFGDVWWYENLRLTRSTFVLLCCKLCPYLKKEVTFFRQPVAVDEQVAVTLWRLATNIEYRTIAGLFGLGISTVCTIVLKTCRVISKHLLPLYVTLPKDYLLL